MESIRHRVGINAPTADVYAALATREGVTGWWTRDIDGDDTVGGRLEFWFGRPHASAVMQVEELTPLQRVAWRCVEGPDEWLDAPITFDLKADGDETVVMFQHGGWREPVEFMHHCSTAWGYYLLSLKRDLEDGKGTPWPDNMKISSWG
jgi:uncharacterized protein YndB with AHSA1/START domain